MSKSKTNKPVRSPRRFRVLGIDLGSVGGWCVLDRDGLVARGPLAWRKTRRRGETKSALLQERVFATVRAVTDAIDTYEPTHVAVCSPAGARYSVTAVHWPVIGGLLYELADAYAQVEVVEFRADNSMKKAFAGSGTATKEQIVARALELYPEIKNGPAVLTDHEADACGVAWCALQSLTSSP